MIAKTALITGGSSGIGKELASLFAADGYGLVLTARGGDALEAAADRIRRRFGVAVLTIAADLANQATPQAIYERICVERIEVGALVNDAGFATYGAFSQTDLKTELEMIEVNVSAVVHLTKLFLPGMRRRAAGKILNVASTAAFFPGPLMAVYYASKAFVLSFSRALAEELRGSGITVTALCPGPTTSGFQRRAGMEDSKLLRGRVMDAPTVAQAGYRGLMRGKGLVVPGARYRLLALAARLAPTRLTTRVVRRMQERR
ncbi:MAG: SDR family oxidoreductase [Candidatus Eremiobacteraeota bacterium]|nr:SDR family oxidoreductase [Candidatus Eremiobacteraeota bacterium]